MIQTGFLVSRRTQVQYGACIVHFVYRAITVFGAPFQESSTIHNTIALGFTGYRSTDLLRIYGNGLSLYVLPQLVRRRIYSIQTPYIFGLFPFRSPLLRESHSFYFPLATEMFHFARFPPYTYVFSV
jgi:hypothetical protein